MVMDKSVNHLLSASSKLRMNLHTSGKIEDDEAPKSLAYENGNLFLDNEHVPNSTLHHDNKIVWSRQKGQDSWEHGAFQLRSNGMSGITHLTRSKDQEGLQDVTYTRFDAGSVPTDYDCKRSKNPLADDLQNHDTVFDFSKLPSTDDKVLDFGKLETAINIPDKDDLNHKIPYVTAKLQYQGTSNFQAFKPTVITTNKNNQLHICITMNPFYFDAKKIPEDNRFIYYECIVGVLGDTFNGFCQKYDKRAPEDKGKKYHWFGKVNESNDVVQAMSVGEMQASPAADATDGPTVGQEALDCAEKCDRDLSVMGLLDLKLPDPNDTFMGYMSQCVIHNLDGDYRQNLLGKSDPDFDGQPGVKDVANDEAYKDFFKNNFGIGYLLEGLKKTDDLKDDFTDDYKKKLASYWKGGTDGTLAKSKIFGDVHYKLSRVAYLDQTVGLQDYIDNGGEDWADKMYAAISTPTEIANMAAQDTYHNGVYQKYVMLLYCLNPKKDYVSLLQEKIAGSKLKILMGFFKGSSEKIIKDIVEGLSKYMITKIMNGDAALFTDIQNELNQLKKAMNIQSSAAFNITMNGTMVDVLNLAFFVEKNQSIYERITGAADKVAKKLKIGPKGALAFKVIGKLGMALGFAFSLYMSITALCDWDDLKDSQKAQMIVQVGQYAVNTVKIILDVGEDFNNYIQTKNYWKMYEVMEMKPLNSEGNVLANCTDELTEGEKIEMVLGKSLKTFVSESKYAKFFNIASKTAQGFTLVLSAAASAVLAYKLYTDFADDAPMYEKVLDVLQLAIGLGQTLCMGLSMTTNLSCVPIVGAVLAIAGAIVTIVQLILEKVYPPKSPAQKFFEKEAPGFFKKITIDPKIDIDDTKKGN